MNKEILHSTSMGSMNGTMSFPQIVQILTQEGVESYQIDLAQNLKTFYMPSGEVFKENFAYKSPSMAIEFSQEKVVAAIRSSQAGKINYIEFLNQILHAGVLSYNVYLKGRKAIYFGRHGDFHIENFPAVK